MAIPLGHDRECGCGPDGSVLGAPDLAGPDPSKFDPSGSGPVPELAAPELSGPSQVYKCIVHAMSKEVLPEVRLN